MWRHYRGGRTHPISVINLSDHSVQKLPWTNSNDSFPMWIGNTIYFISDRSHTANLFAYRTDTKQLTQISNHEDFDVMTASAGADAVVYEQAGYIYLVDAKSGKPQKLNIEVTGDLPWARPQFKKVATMIRNATLSPTGTRAAFEARGEIFTVPSEKGDFRNLTQSAGAHDRDPVWSPDGAQVAWLSDASGEYQLMIGEPTGVTPARAVALPSTAFFSGTRWSPDGKQILLEDNHNNLWAIEVASGAATKIDTDSYPDPVETSTRPGLLIRSGSRIRRAFPATCARSLFIHGLIRRLIKSLTDSPTPSHRRSTRAESTCTSWQARTMDRVPAGWK